MVDIPLQQQQTQSKQIKSNNQALSLKYNRYLSKTLNTLTTSQTLETPLLLKINNIYENDESILKQLQNLKKLNDKLSIKELELNNKLKKSTGKLIKMNLYKGCQDDNEQQQQQQKQKVRKDQRKDIVHDLGHNVAQEKVEKLDQNIRILENCIRLVEMNDSKPILKVKHGLFG
ncbi:hypothetical protein CANARDRAFT_24082 [[Candida] arabinofermentans NRRL YB-2248]|uniref:Uncharacterized protein n=1 Tax=[Candida] arabinofermentans NRRL YB-2248 TaxID=983967 RepID=A0A1E4SXT6_9ASCO|nr:hypothetical protein CANARDRAFT_24082 [[Candida] arabinofermentans NRRL YB-2248]